MIRHSIKEAFPWFGRGNDQQRARPSGAGIGAPAHVAGKYHQDYPILPIPAGMAGTSGMPSSEFSVTASRIMQNTPMTDDDIEYYASTYAKPPYDVNVDMVSRVMPITGNGQNPQSTGDLLAADEEEDEMEEESVRAFIGSVLRESVINESKLEKAHRRANSLSAKLLKLDDRIHSHVFGNGKEVPEKVWNQYDKLRAELADVNDEIAKLQNESLRYRYERLSSSAWFRKAHRGKSLLELLETDIDEDNDEEDEIQDEMSVVGGIAGYTGPLGYDASRKKKAK